MACACGKVGSAEQIRAMEMSYARRDGTYSLYGWPDCEGSYSGPGANTSLFVVARNLPAERLFLIEELADAADYSNTLEPRGPIERLPASTLCAEAVAATFARAAAPAAP